MVVSKADDPSSEPKKFLEEQMERHDGNLIAKINQLKEEIAAERVVKIKDKLDKSGKKLQSHIHELLSATCIENSSQVENRSSEVPPLAVENALCLFPPGSADNDFDVHEAIFSKSTKLPKVQRIPSYTTWIFLDRNQKMSVDQSVVGRRRIYYDQSGNEALICSDSDDDIAEVEEEKPDFSEVEDRILLMAFQEHGVNEDVANVVSQFIRGTPSEILERYNELKLKFEATHAQGSDQRNIFLQRSLSGALDSFDTLFCRRCLIFDCRLHGCSQSLVYPSEKQSSWSEAEDRKPCSEECYLLNGRSTENLVEGSDIGSFHRMDRGTLEGKNTGSGVVSFEENIDSDDAGMICSLGFDAGDSYNVGGLSAATVVPVAGHIAVGKRKNADTKDKVLDGVDNFKDSLDKKQKKVQAVEATALAGEILNANGLTTSTSNDITFQQISNSQTSDIVKDVCGISRRLELEQSATLLEGQREISSSSSGWKPLEKGLYMKGLEIFGTNSCLIARNLLSGMKTCTEVFNYMHDNGTLLTRKRDSVRCPEDCARADSDYMEQEIPMRPRSRLFRKRGRTRRLKYSSKSNGHPSSWKRVGDGDQSCKQYTPCTCRFTCGKDCSCLKNGICCEKYCGCSKSCKNRFRGCHCAKSQCRSRQCPCFAANRECDPDVCRNCWVSCGGDSLGEPPKKGDGQCGNMRLLLKQRQRILLARSDVAGWGAFIKNSVNKHDFLGEYTGELVSHREADKRGKIYDRSDASFLFDLNDQYVLDAFRRGNRLKFANHSAKPNCYCKIMLVAGDHRVGIFAKERIEAKEELFYDYQYAPDQAPAWARKPEASKKDDSFPHQGRARKHQSR